MHCMSTLFSILCSFVLPFYYLMLLSFSIWGSCASFMIPWRKLTLRHFENKQCKGWQCHSKKVPFWPLVEARPSKVLYIYIRWRSNHNLGLYRSQPSCQLWHLEWLVAAILLMLFGGLAGAYKHRQARFSGVFYSTVGEESDGISWRTWIYINCQASSRSLHVVATSCCLTKDSLIFITHWRSLK